MKFGLSLPNKHGVERIEDLVTLAQEAEQAGFKSVWASEHLFHTSYVAERLGTRPYHEALTVLTAVASATTKIRLGTSVVVLPWHHPVRLAKVVASLDQLSDGRVDLGVGVAQARDEYENLGVDFAARGHIADDMIVAMKSLWSQDIPEHEGAFFRFKGLRFEPKPIQKPHVPLLVGGNSARALRRVIEHGDGWHALGQSPDEMRRGVSSIKAARGELTISVCLRTKFVSTSWDRPVTERRTMTGTQEELLQMVEAYANSGVDQIVVDANTADLGITRALINQVSETLIP